MERAMPMMAPMGSLLAACCRACHAICIFVGDDAGEIDNAAAAAAAAARGGCWDEKDALLG